LIAAIHLNVDFAGRKEIIRCNSDQRIVGESGAQELLGNPLLKLDQLSHRVPHRHHRRVPAYLGRSSLDIEHIRGSWLNKSDEEFCRSYAVLDPYSGPPFGEAGFQLWN